MKLHRSESKPDWQAIDINSQNAWQRIAASTNGLVTPGNLVTLIGIGLVVWGLFDVLRENYWSGSVLIIIGRLCDLLDGWLAESTGTKSPLGELLDASIDKLGTILTIVIFYIANLAPFWVLTLLLLPHIVIIAISIIARRNNVTLHPSRVGKVSMAALWVALFGLLIVRALDLAAGSIVSITVDVIAASSIILGCYAAVGYLQNRD